MNTEQSIMKVRFISVSATGCFYSLEQLSELKIFMVTEHYCCQQLYIKIAIGVCVSSVVLCISVSNINKLRYYGNSWECILILFLSNFPTHSHGM